jgi:high affinity sulfate transporter 1
VNVKLLERAAPGIGLARRYEKAWLHRDVVAGLVLATMLVPQGMAYAQLAGLPAVTGLYTTIACLVAYAVFGPSRILVLGPDSSVSPLIFAAIVPLVVVRDDPGRAIALAGILALLVGLIEIGLGLGKLGFVADLLSKEVQIGYLNGLAITILVGQLPRLFGFSTNGDTFVDAIRTFVESLDETVGWALTVGLAVLVTLLVVPRITRRVPAVLVAVVAATAASTALNLSERGVTTVGTLPSGFPTPSMPWTSIADLGPLAIAAAGITLVSLTDTIATSSSFAARRGEHVNPNQEMIAVGTSNIAAGLVQGFAVSTSSSRTAVAEQTGAKTQLTGVVGAGAVVVLLLFLNSLLADLPQSVLAAVVIAAAFSLIDVDSLRRYARVRPTALILSVATTVGVIVLGVLPGIVLAILLAILLFFRRYWWPHGSVLGYVDSAGTWSGVDDHRDAVEHDGIVVYRWEAPLFFANAGAFRNQIRALVRHRHPSWVVLQCQAITDIDVTAAEMLEQLVRELHEKGIHLAVAELRTRLQDLTSRYGLFETMNREHFYPTLQAAIAAIEAEHDASTPDPA